MFSNLRKCYFVTLIFYKVLFHLYIWDWCVCTRSFVLTGVLFFMVYMTLLPFIHFFIIPVWVVFSSCRRVIHILSTLSFQWRKLRASSQMTHLRCHGFHRSQNQRMNPYLLFWAVVFPTAQQLSLFKKGVINWRKCLWALSSKNFRKGNDHFLRRVWMFDAKGGLLYMFQGKDLCMIWGLHLTLGLVSVVTMRCVLHGHRSILLGGWPLTHDFLASKTG